MRYTLLAAIVLLLSCNHQPVNQRQYINLAGQWQFSMDTAKTGINQQWYLTDLPDSITLPGTMDENRKGFLNKDTTTMHLNRVYTYAGPAWYRKKVTIPQSFQDKHISLVLERTKSTSVWVDNQPAGQSKLLQSMQVYDLSKFLTPGIHSITIRVDNTLAITPYGNVHIYSDDTETNWNGIIGRIELEASDKTYITDLQVFPDIYKKEADINLSIENPLKQKNLDITMQVQRIDGGKTKNLQTIRKKVHFDSIIHLEYPLGLETELWDDYKQPLYELTLTIGDGEHTDSKTVSFGMRKFSTRGTQFTINGHMTFLRGKHDACVFPLTGHPPMDVEGWMRVFKIAKSYGINHYRFHSYCPPEAAFIAADRLGIYIQAELPFWGGLDSDTIAGMLREEGIAMLKNYANHPSFVMFSHGNEIWSGHDRVEQNILFFKKQDNRPLYTMGSNNGIGYVPPRACSDYFVAARTPWSHDSILTHVRLTHAFADSREGGILNTQQPSTEVTFRYPVSQMKIPIIGHEIGQYQTYPDYAEIKKYTGVLRARNLEIFEKRLKNAGMLDQNKDFQKASGALAALCYKAEMEAAIRTPGFAGFQLLDLQDFPGQGTALVGMLDAFMDDKQVVDRKVWLQSCNDVVVLSEFPKYCYANTENFEAKIQVANYSNRPLTDDVNWEIINHKGERLATGSFANQKLVNGKITDAGTIRFSFTTLRLADELRLKVSLKKAGYNNEYPVWVYPKSTKMMAETDILIASKMNASVLARLKEGKKVLLFPMGKDVKKNSVSGLFPPEFWNWGMFKGISEWVKKPVSPGTLGILTDPKHPIFEGFPTEFHTNWQWWSIIKAGHPISLNNTAPDYRPIVQVIDNLERNNKLGLIFEFRAGKGKLLVCMSRLPEILDKPEANALYNSLINYMKSTCFNPAHEMDDKALSALFQ